MCVVDGLACPGGCGLCESLLVDLPYLALVVPGSVELIELCSQGTTLETLKGKNLCPREERQNLHRVGLCCGDILHQI